MNELLTVFFNKTFENEINNNLQELSYKLPKEEVLAYVKKIIDMEIEEFLSWIDYHHFFTIDSSDMPQLSDFNAAFYDVVNKLIRAGDKGFRYVEIGLLLQNDGIVRNDMANRKYGENHSKASEYLGYLYSLHYHYYVSCIGYILEFLNETEKDKLFVRLLIRTNLFKAVYLFTKNSSLKFRTLFDVLSDKTYRRRLAGTKLILSSLNMTDEYNFDNILNKIEY